MKFTNYDVVFQEVPGEVSLSFTITGCRLACKGCHSTHTWNPNVGTELTNELLLSLLDKYRGLITCILFLGGEWEEYRLEELLVLCKDDQLRTALYTGLDDVSDRLKNQLTYLKVGKWDATKGGLWSPNTNQKMIELSTGKILNHLFL